MFVKIIRKSSVVTGLLLIACGLAAWALLTWPEAAAAGISRGLSICTSVIIPSLFPFLVLAGFLVKSGISAAVGRRLERPTRLIFGLPGCCAAGILVSLVGGFPAGAVAVGGLVRQGSITPAQGKRMLCFCVNAGPAFIISAVGVGMMGSAAYGVMLYIAHIAASLIMGVLFSIGLPRDQRCSPTQTEIATASSAEGGGMQAFVRSVTDACRSMLLMCGFILLFAAALSLIDGSGLSRITENAVRDLLGGDPSHAVMKTLSCILPGILEVSCGSLCAAAAGGAAPLLLGMGLGWGGFSVQCQISATLHDLRLTDRNFFMARGLHALMGGVFSVLLFRYVPVAAPVVSSLDRPVGAKAFMPFATSASTAAALLFMCGLFLLSVPGKDDA